MLLECKEHAGIKNSTGLLINERTFISSSPLVFETDADCMKEDSERCRVLRYLNKRSFCTQNPTIQQYPDSMEELLEDDEPPPKKNRKLPTCLNNYPQKTPQHPLINNAQAPVMPPVSAPPVNHVKFKTKQ